MLKEALFWKRLKDKILRCNLCPRFCIINDGKRGNCGVRENKGGKLYSLVYGKPISLNLDPIEKKPLYHFLPSEKTLSFGTAGCNLHCMYCQNYEISQCSPEELPATFMMPDEIIKTCKKEKSRIISYTYTEPTIFYEYMLDTSKLASKEKLKNVIVSNGFINPEPLENLKTIDAANIDFKGNAEFYKKIAGAFVEPVQETLLALKKKNVWLEITNLIVPTLNDSEKDIKFIVDWIYENLGSDVPLHFSAFWPTYKLKNLPPTSIETLRNARKIAMKKLNYVYVGNVPISERPKNLKGFFGTGNLADEEGSTTFCPKCRKAVIKRQGFAVMQNKIRNGKCPCGERIAGIWK
jgi:pyruvate formate lyase activating enzyme